MFLIRYDILLVVGAGYPGGPVEVIMDLGYRDILLISHQGTTLFLEVFSLMNHFPYSWKGLKWFEGHVEWFRDDWI